MMNLEEQQQLFIERNKAVINYVKNNFYPFNSSMLDAYFLAQFYIDAVNNGEAILNNDVLNSYKDLFWFWVNARLRRMYNNAEADRIARELDVMAEDKSGQEFNLFGWLGLGSLSWIPVLLIGGLVIYGIRVLKR